MKCVNSKHYCKNRGIADCLLDVFFYPGTIHGMEYDGKFLVGCSDGEAII